MPKKGPQWRGWRTENWSALGQNHSASEPLPACFPTLPLPQPALSLPPLFSRQRRSEKSLRPVSPFDQGTKSPDRVASTLTPDIEPPSSQPSPLTTDACPPTSVARNRPSSPGHNFPSFPQTGNRAIALAIHPEGRLGSGPSCERQPRAVRGHPLTRGRECAHGQIIGGKMSVKWEAKGPCSDERILG